LIEKQPDEAPWTIQQTLLGIIVTVVPWLLFAIVLNSLNRGATQNLRTVLPPRVDFVPALVTLIFSSLVEGAFLIGPLYFAYHAFRFVSGRARLAWQALGFRSFHVGMAFAWIILLLVVILSVNVLYGYLIQTFHLPLQTNDQLILKYSKHAPLTTYATLIVAVFVAPFCEEVFFRGFVFAGLRRGMPLVWAIVLSALIFAVAHADPGSFAVLFIIGLALAFLRWRTKSLWPGIFLHALNNGAAALTVVLYMQGIGR